MLGDCGIYSEVFNVEIVHEIARQMWKVSSKATQSVSCQLRRDTSVYVLGSNEGLMRAFAKALCTASTLVLPPERNVFLPFMARRLLPNSHLKRVHQ